VTARGRHDSTILPPGSGNPGDGHRSLEINGLRMGLVDNSKFNSRTLLLKLAERLEMRFHVSLSHIHSKTSSNHYLQGALLEEFKRKTDFAITGVGD